MIAKNQNLSIFERARGVIAGGVDSPVRAGAVVGGEPFVQAAGKGAYAYDTQGRRYIDYLMAYGPLLLGHAHPIVSEDLDEIAALGVVYGSTHEREVALAERIRGYLPSMERMRFATTGTEAVMSAIRIARAFTRASGVVKFAGNYHGHSDFALLGAGASAHTDDAIRAGIPASTLADVGVAGYNDLESLDRAADGLSDLAAIVVEPIVGNMGLVRAEPGFLEGIVRRARERGALVIFDEIITWPRIALEGAQGAIGLVPDLTTLGKNLGGGFPLAAYGGRADVMSVLAPEGPTFAGGTHAGNPFSIAIGHRVLDLLEAEPQLYAKMRGLAVRLADGIRRSLRALDLTFAVVQLESIVDFKFRAGPPTRSYDDQGRASASAYAAYYHRMRERGILLPPSQNEVMFLSTEHSASDIDETVVAIDASLHELRKQGIV